MFSLKEIIIIVLFAAILGLGASRYLTSTKKSSVSKYSHMGGNFTLTGKEGPISLSQFRNKNVILYFGFTHCPDVCPLSLSNLGSNFKKLPEVVQNDLQVIFISVDHRRDKPKEVHSYAAYFDPSFIGVTGSKDLIKKVTKSYGVTFEYEEIPESELKYTVNHTSRYFFINKSGVLIDATPDTIKFEDFRKKVLSL